MKNKSEETQVVKSQTGQVMPTGGGTSQLGTIFGIEAGDMRIPYVYLVRSGNRNAILEDDSKATVGFLYHATKKEQYESIEVLIAHASKGKSTSKKPDTGEVVTSACYRAIIVPLDDLNKPFMTTFKGVNLWDSWKNFISELAETNRSNLDVVVKMSSKMVDTNYGSTEAFELEIVGEATKEQSELMLEISNRFGGLTAKIIDDEDGEKVEEVVTTDVASDEFTGEDPVADILETPPF